MITVNYPEKTISMKNLNQVLFNEDFIKQIARLMIADHIECFHDMSQDMEGDRPKTFKEAEAYFDGVKSSLTEGSLPDLLSDFRTSLYEAIENATVDLKNVTVTADGMDDIEVEIS